MVRLVYRRLPIRRAKLSLLLGLPIISACFASPDREAPPRVSVTDSAGIEIVFSAAPLHGGAEWLRIDPHPLVEIGTSDGARPGHDLHYAMSAVELSDGTMVVANSGSEELRYFDRSGNLLATAGRTGAGPGEFVSLTWPIGAVGDTVWAYDSRLRRISFFDSRAEFIRQVQLRDLWLYHITNLLSDFSMIAQEGGASPAGPPGTYREPHKLFRIHPDGLSNIELAMLAGFEGYRTLGPSGGCCTYTSPPFPRGTQLASDGEWIYIGEQDDFEIRVIDADGVLKRLIRRAYEPRVVTDEMIARRAERRLAALENQPEWRTIEQRILAETRYPEILPAHGRLLTDPHGRLWVQEYRNPWENPPLWSVFDTAGQWLGNATLPDGLILLSIGRDHLIGKMVDDLDVEKVLVYRIAADRGLTP